MRPLFPFPWHGRWSVSRLPDLNRRMFDVHILHNYWSQRWSYPVIWGVWCLQEVKLLAITHHVWRVSPGRSGTEHFDEWTGTAEYLMWSKLIWLCVLSTLLELFTQLTSPYSLAAADAVLFWRISSWSGRIGKCMWVDKLTHQAASTTSTAWHFLPMISYYSCTDFQSVKHRTWHLMDRQRTVIK